MTTAAGTGSGQSGQTVMVFSIAKKSADRREHIASPTAYSLNRSLKDWLLIISAGTADVLTLSIFDKQHHEKTHYVGSALPQKNTHRPNASMAIRSLARMSTYTRNVVLDIAELATINYPHLEGRVKGIRESANAAMLLTLEKCVSPAICTGTKRSDR